MAVGQAGNQIADQFWQLIAQEHKIGLDGMPTNGEPTGRTDVFFRKVSNRYVPRAVLVDLEPAVLKSVSDDAKPNFYDPKNKVHGADGAGNNFAVGHTEMGAQYLEQVIGKIKNEVEKTDSLGGFIVTHSVGGGTGSGFGTLIMQNIRKEYPNTPLLSFSIYPSPRISDVLTEPYNAIFSSYRLVRDTSCSIIYDNDALYTICQNLGIAEPTYSDLNKLISQSMVNITAGMRFVGTLNLDLRKLITNLVPHPRLHFLMTSTAPLVESGGFDSQSIEKTAEVLFEKSNIQAQVNTEDGAYISTTVLFRGNVNPADMDTALRAMKQKLKFVSFIPTGFKTGLSATAPNNMEFAAALVANHTGITQVFKRILGQFDKLWSRKAFSHWYTDSGLTEEDIVNARNDIAKLVEEYEETLKFKSKDKSGEEVAAAEIAENK
ncbi:MAG: tubulin beta chain [Candidatus Heimdallarchaeota archaeon]|nr:tubulin beta chain [Candidatus Heimdallarchaeota archaeon]MDH5644663.1 tubulin beta chain [Candidatus Heimdallarchaeota archaeon]